MHCAYAIANSLCRNKSTSLGYHPTDRTSTFTRCKISSLGLPYAPADTNISRQYSPNFTGCLQCIAWTTIKFELTAVKVLTLHTVYLAVFIRLHEQDNTRSSERNRLEPIINLELSKRAFLHAVHTVWNNFPQTARPISDRTVTQRTFKSLPQNCLLQSSVPTVACD